MLIIQTSTADLKFPDFKSTTELFIKYSLPAELLYCCRLFTFTNNFIFMAIDLKILCSLSDYLIFQITGE